MHRPKLLIADDPTAGLVVTIQGRVLNLMQSLARECGTAQLIVTADLGMAAWYLRQGHALGTYPARFLRVPDPSLFTSVARRRSSLGAAARPVRTGGAGRRTYGAASMRDQRLDLRLLGDIDRGRQAAVVRAISRAVCSFLSAITMQAPPAAKKCTQLVPMPLAPPVTTIKQPAKSRSMSSSRCNLSSPNPSSERRHGNRRRHQVARARGARRANYDR
jgi:hypothetical protein